jgi:hypothetical protein
MSTFRTLVRSAFNAVRLPFAWPRYRRTGLTSAWAHQALIQLFCATGGRSNDLLSSMLRRGTRRLRIDSPVGVLGDLRGDRMTRPLEALRSRGYVTFPAVLSSEMCDRLLRFACESPATVRRMDEESAPTEPRVAYFDRENPVAVRYDYPPEALLGNADVQWLLADPSLLALAQEYLGSRPKADVLSMWWHTKYKAQPDSEAAQFYHFDLDRIKWLKVFIYLTDVGPEDGPHSFIEGSHRTRGIPASMLNRGYVRLTDDEVLGHYGPQREIRFEGPRGTIIVEDTRGLHKGNAVRQNARLILQLQFSNSLFGATYAKAKLPEVRQPRLQSRMRDAADVYSQFL